METLDTIDAIRKRPGMYIGDPHDGTGLHHTLWEVVGNCLDLYYAGKLTRVGVTLGNDGSIRVSDDGPGISLEKDRHGVTFLESVFTELHLTPTADGHAPHVHLGNWGVGLCAVNAVSSWLRVSTGTEPRVRQRFERGRVTNPAETVASGERGTTVEWLPDGQIFSHTHWDSGLIAQRLRELAHLCPGLTTTFRMAAQTWGPAEDIRPLVRDLRGHRPMSDEILCTAEDGPLKAKVALLWCTHAPYVPRPAVISFCNLMRTQDGTHVKGCFDGVHEVLRERLGVTDKAQLKTLCAGLRAVVSVTLIDPQYGAPTRDELRSPEARNLVRRAITTDLPAALDADPPLVEALRLRLSQSP